MLGAFTWEMLINLIFQETGRLKLQARQAGWSGRHDGEAEFAVTLESAGQVTFTAI